MGSDSESTDLDREVDESMRMFERSRVGAAAPLTPIEPARVLLVLDGSPQDDASVDAARYLHERFSVETLVLDARDDVESVGESKSDTGVNAVVNDLAPDRAANCPGSRPIKRKPGDAYDAILAALDQHDVDVVIVPCPFGRSFEHLGADSAGTVIDVLLSRCPKPLLVIRRDDQRLRDCAGTVSMIIGAECDVEERAAAWAFGLASKGAVVTLDLVIEREQYQNIRSIIEALHPDESFDPEQFADALTKTHQAIHGAMSKTATARGMTYRMRPQASEVAPPNPLDDTSHLLIVIPLEVDDRFGQGFVQDRIRRSPHPVLVVTGHVTR